MWTKIVVWMVTLSYLKFQAGANTCGQTFTKPSGSIKSPNYPKSYPNNLNCTWRIEVSNGNIISLRTTTFDLEKSYQCESDALYVYDGPDIHAKQIGSPYCGSGAPLVITSSNNTLFIVFITDFVTRRNGFQLDYEVVPTCRQVIKKDSGEITSPRYPSSYYPNANCSYLIIAGPQRQIHIQFLDFDLEPHPPASVECYDYVAVYDVLPVGLRHLKTMCGSGLPSSIYSTSNKLLVVFLSDSSVVRRGFRAAFTSSYRSCKSNEFTCKNGLCLNTSRLCDSKDDCGDGSDEASCSCGHNEWMCFNGGCILGNGTCNGVKDCDDGSDEKNCSVKRNVTRPCDPSLPSCQIVCVYSGPTSSCHCSAGYKYNTKTEQCQDENECDVGNGGCREKCINFPGGYRCGCHDPGYTVKNGRCVDIDECTADEHDCHQVCINTIGSYKCDCAAGYVISHDDPRKCRDINECLEGVPGCFGTCINNVGSFYCECEKGFMAIKNRTRCQDIDECAVGSSGCMQLCRNTMGSYRCYCREGFRQVFGDGQSCEDVDECHQKNPCDQGCVNTYGSFRCTCRKGYQMVNNTKCVDINECLNPQKYRCHGICVNTIGSFNCTCPKGSLLQKDGTCVDEKSYSICGKASIARNPSKWRDVSSEAIGWQAFFSVTLGSFWLLLDECMGTILTERLILTAAHCLYLRNWAIPAANLTVHVGATDITNPEQNKHLVEDIVVHKDSFLSTVALVKLRTPLKFNRRVHAVCLSDHPLHQRLRTGTSATVLAWRRSMSQGEMSQLQYRSVTVKPIENCRWKLPQNESQDSFLCTLYNGEVKGKSCLPASGAPLMIKTGIQYGAVSRRSWVLSGILIYGGAHPERHGCMRKYRFTVFHHLQPFIRWIKKAINGPSCKQDMPCRS